MMVPRKTAVKPMPSEMRLPMTIRVLCGNHVGANGNKY
jgi:hypothetical protein